MRALLLLIAIFAILSATRIAEDDIYMQIRAGYEVLQHANFSFQDTWSFTANEQTWNNYYWVPTVIFAATYRVAGDAGLVALRCFLVFALFAAIALITKRSSKSFLTANSKHILLLSLVFVVCASRLQLRPETFGFIIFAALIWLWCKTDDRKQVYLWTPILILLWANCHGGTAVVGLFTALVFLFADIVNKRRQNFSLREPVKATVFSIVAFFATPLGFKIIPVLATHFSYDTNLVWNTEWDHLSFQHFDPIHHGPAYLLMAVFFVAAVVTFIRNDRSKNPLPGIFSNRFAFWTMTVALAWMSCDRVRIIPYLAIFLVAPAAAGIEKYKKTAPLILASFAIVFASVGFIAYNYLPKWGFGRNEHVYPTALYNFIDREKPAAPLFSSFAVANLQLLKLPDYKTFVDPRDVIFDRVKEDYKKAFSHPDGMKAVLEKYSINSVFIEIPKLIRPGAVQQVDALEYFLPNSQWALVAFSDRKAVFARRMPANAQVIAANEYFILRPALPPIDSAQNAGAARKEAERCLSLTPNNVFCKLVMVTVLRTTQDALDYARSNDIVNDLSRPFQDLDETEEAYIRELR